MEREERGKEEWGRETASFPRSEIDWGSIDESLVGGQPRDAGSCAGAGTHLM